MSNKTTSVPEDVLPIIENLDMPFSRWVSEQLRLHASGHSSTFAEQLRTDAALAEAGSGDLGRRPTLTDNVATGQRMDRSASC